jgi:hypothetical protein
MTPNPDRVLGSVASLKEQCHGFTFSLLRQEMDDHSVVYTIIWGIVVGLTAEIT